MNTSGSKKLTCVDFHGKEYEVSSDQLRWRPSVYAIVIRDNKLLLTRQVKTYNLPGGGIEFGEMPEDALVREVQEETGITVANPQLVACKSTLFKGLRADDIDDFFQSILLFYVCEFVGGELSIDGIDDHEQTWTEPPVWLPLDAIDTVVAGGRPDWRPIVKEFMR